MKQGPIPGGNIAHNTASRGYRRGELDDDSAPVNRPLNIAHNTLPQVFARMGLLPQGVVESLKDFVSGGRHPGSVGEKRTLPNPVLLAEKLSQCGLELRTNHVTVML